MATKIYINKHLNRVVDATCCKCKSTTKHEILADILERGSEADDSYSWDDDYQIIQCRGCQNICFRKVHTDSESANQGVHYMDHSGSWVGLEDEQYIEDVSIFPKPLERPSTIKEMFLLPTEVQFVYKETLAAFNEELYILAAIGVGATIEAVCVARGMKARTLKDKINDLVIQGVITKDQAGILHRLRDLRNDGAHMRAIIEISAVGLALDVIDHLLQGLYIIPKRYNPGEALF